MSELTLEEMKNRNIHSAYILEKDGDYFVFTSEKAACDFLGISKNRVAVDCAIYGKTHGYNIIKAFSEKDIYCNNRLHSIWYAMKDRCYNPKHPYYEKYGGSGITVCEAWLNSYIEFAKWAFSNGYEEDLTIDRIDNSKGYEPKNCKWSTQTEQCNNRCTNRVLEYKGERYTLANLSRKVGIKKTTLGERLKRGWSVEEAAETPVGIYHNMRKGEKLWKK